MCVGPLKPPKIPPPAPPPEPPDEDDELSSFERSRLDEVRGEARKRQRNLRGTGATILTSGQGLLGQHTTAGRSLLGGQ